MYLRQRCFDGWLAQWIKTRLAAAANTYTSDFPDVKFCVSAHIAEKAIRFRHTDYNPDRTQKLISSSMSRHLSTRNVSSKSMHAFLSNFANRQTDRQTNTGKNIYLLLCRRWWIWTYSLTHDLRCRFEWPRVTLSYLQKYSMTPSIARSICESWASCDICTDGQTDGV